MYFDSFEAFIAMDGHGPYVWICYGVALLILGYNIASPMMQKKEVLKRIRRNLKRENSSS